LIIFILAFFILEWSDLIQLCTQYPPNKELKIPAFTTQLLESNNSHSNTLHDGKMYVENFTSLVWVVLNFRYSDLISVGNENSVEMKLFVRDEIDKLLLKLDSLKLVCSNSSPTITTTTGQSSTNTAELSSVRAITIVGPSGVGKSCAVFGWTMMKATHAQRKETVAWIHFRRDKYHVLFVKNGWGKTTQFKRSPSFVDRIVQLLVEFGCTIVVLDSLKDDIKSLFSELYLCKPEMIIISCTSHKSANYGSEDFAAFADGKYESNYLVHSWKWDDYVSAFHNNLFDGYFTNIIELEQHYNIAGGCIRFMYWKQEQVIAYLDLAIQKIDDFPKLLGGVQGLASQSTINCLIQTFPTKEDSSRPTSILLSEYVCKSLRSKVDKNFINMAYEVYAKNGSACGWVFEMEFKYRAILSIRMQSEFLFRKRKNEFIYPFWRSEWDYRLIITKTSDFDGKNIIHSDMHDLVISEGGVKSGCLFECTKVNQGCFDFIFYYKINRSGNLEHHFVFFQCTVASQHNFKIKYIAEFLGLCFGVADSSSRNNPRQIGSLIKIHLNVVTTAPNFQNFVVYDSNVEDVNYAQIYDPTFTASSIRITKMVGTW